MTGYVGRCITNGTATFEDILKQSCKGSTLDYREAELAAKMLIDGISENLKNGKIVDLGVLGKLYPAVNGKWDENADNLQLADMKPKVNYKAGADIEAASSWRKRNAASVGHRSRCCQCKKSPWG